MAYENLHLRERLIKYEQINQYIEVLISKNVELEEVIKKERALATDEIMNI